MTESNKSNLSKHGKLEFLKNPIVKYVIYPLIVLCLWEVILQPGIESILKPDFSINILEQSEGNYEKFLDINQTQTMELNIVIGGPKNDELAYSFEPWTSSKKILISTISSKIQGGAVGSTPSKFLLNLTGEEEGEAQICFKALNRNKGGKKPLKVNPECLLVMVD